jgi:hypothetical protein
MPVDRRRLSPEHPRWPIGECGCSLELRIGPGHLDADADHLDDREWGGPGRGQLQGQHTAERVSEHGHRLAGRDLGHRVSERGCHTRERVLP